MNCPEIKFVLEMIPQDTDENVLNMLENKSLSNYPTAQKCIMRRDKNKRYTGPYEIENFKTFIFCLKTVLSPKLRGAIVNFLNTRSKDEN